MSKLVVRSFAMSLDGYAAGPDQSLEHPLGARGPELMDWFFPTRMWQTMNGNDAGETGIDNEIAQQSFVDIGAWIIGRNMFGPVRGPWLDESWKGWWGDEPPYHVPVFVLTHHAREPVAMKGGTVFHFVTDGIDSAVEKAQAAASGKDVRVGGGAATVRQLLRTSRIDEMHLAVRPTLLGSGESLFQGLDMHALGYQCDKVVAGERATHMFLRRRA